jgi:hypothetical protein
MKGRPSVAITIHEGNMTVTAAAGVTTRTLLDYLADYRSVKQELYVSSSVHAC